MRSALLVKTYREGRPGEAGPVADAVRLLGAMGSMGRAEMIRRLDEAAKTAADTLANGPLTPDEQRVITEALARLLPLVADSLQEQIDTETAAGLRDRSD